MNEKSKNKPKRSRSQKFKDLAKERLKNAKWRIRSIGKLSNRSNYAYEEEEVEEIFSTLMFELKTAMAKFGSGTVEDRFRRYFAIDFKQLSALEKTDPELYHFFLKKFDQLGPEGIIKEHIQDVRDRDRGKKNSKSVLDQLNHYDVTMRQLKNTIKNVETKVSEMDFYMKEIGSTILMDEQIRKLKNQLKR